MHSLTFAAVLVAAMPTVANAQGVARELPLKQGARWTYEVAHDLAAVVTVTVHDEGSFQLPEGGTVHQLRVTKAGNPAATYELWAMPDYGVYQYANRDASKRGTLDLAGTPMRLWASNREAIDGGQRRWQWQGPQIAVAFGVGPGVHSTGDWQHHGESLGREEIVVPAGKYQAEHVRIRSEQSGRATCVRELWFAGGVGVVKQVVRRGTEEWSGRLVDFSVGRGEQTQRIRDYLDQQQAAGRGEAFNNAPRVTWIQDAPEAMLLPGRIAVVHTDAGNACYYVDDQSITEFWPTDSSSCAGVAQKVFGQKTARPPPDVPLRPLALLLVRTEAAKHHLGNVRATKVTLQPKRPLPTTGRNVKVEVVGGALDGTERRIAIWLHAGERSRFELVSNLDTDRQKAR